jgi:hypothetical protein
MNHVSGFIMWSVHISESLNALQGVDVDIDHVHLAKSLELLRTSPLAILAGSGHPFSKPAFSFFL